MKKISYFKLLLSLMLVCTSLVGCTPNSQSTNPEENQAEQIDCSQTSDKISLDEAYSNFNNVQTKFLEKLKSAVNNDNPNSSINSSNVSECLKQLQTAITTFENKDLTKLDKNSKDSVTIILKDINANLEEISTKVIEPLKSGLNDTAVTKVQENLRLNITDKGKFGLKKLGEIESFLLVKNQSVKNNIRDLNFQKLSAQVTNLKQENQKLKNPYTLAFWIALLVIFISVFKGIGIKSIGKLTKNRFAGKSKDHKGKDPNKNIPNAIDDSGYRKISEQVYSQIYSQIDAQLNQKISNLDRQIDKKIGLITKDLEQGIENRLETKIKKSLRSRKEETRETQIRIPPRQNTPPPRNQTPVTDTTPPVVSTPQVYNFSTPQWINTYNNNPDSLSRNITEVSETEESLSNRRLESSQPVILEKKQRRGNYWILTEGSCDYLVPSQSLRINEHNYKTVEALFECRNYQPNYSENFKLLKPAVVYPLSGGQTWQLQEPGILQF